MGGKLAVKLFGVGILRNGKYTSARQRMDISAERG